MSRRKLLCRARGISCAGTRIYSPRSRDQLLVPWHKPGVRGRTQRLYKQLDMLLPLHQEARLAMQPESRKHPAHKILCAIPRFGAALVIELIALLQTSHRS